MTGLAGRVGIIGGKGWLGGIIARSLLQAGIVKPAELKLSSRSGTGDFLVDWPELRWTCDNQELTDWADTVILSVRPEQFPAVRIHARDKLVISVMAGVPMAMLAEKTGASRVVRAMPNAAAEIGLSYTPWFANTAVTAADRQRVSRFLEPCGSHDEMSCETDIDYMTALTGSGPAFPALLAASMYSHAVARGIAGDIAMRAVKATVSGGGQLLAFDERSPEETVRRFLDYRGTTAAGLSAMLEAGFDTAVIAGLAAAERAAIRIKDSVGGA